MDSMRAPLFIVAPISALRYTHHRMNRAATTKLRALRKRKGISQEELETASCVSQATISDMETRGPGPAVANAIALAKALGTTVEELFADDARRRLPSTAVRGRRRERTAPAGRSRDSAA
jgi:transcriptional regulator with XRE-family HTH domain